MRIFFEKVILLYYIMYNVACFICKLLIVS
nr:MAG TPA: hypothetical protein [Caudoviricetes sp.]